MAQLRLIALTLTLTLTAGFATGCRTDVVISPELKALPDKRIHVADFTADTEGIGHVIRDVMIKELLREGVTLSSENQANLFITGAAFLTDHTRGRSGIFTASSMQTQAIESVSVVIKTRDGTVMGSGSYNNSKRKSAAEIGKALGEEIADELD